MILKCRFQRLIIIPWVMIIAISFPKVIYISIHNLLIVIYTNLRLDSSGVENVSTAYRPDGATFSAAEALQNTIQTAVGSMDQKATLSYSYTIQHGYPAVNPPNNE
jgi:hypothetical protein